MNRMSALIGLRSATTVGTGRRQRHLWWFAAALVVLPAVISCSSGSNGGPASVALLVKIPAGAQQKASLASASGFLAKLWTWVIGTDMAWAQTVNQPICSANCRLLIDVSATDLAPQYTRIENVSHGAVTVNLSLPSGSERIFRVTLEQNTGAGFFPIKAGCHSGVDLVAGASVSVPIELRDVSSCLRVIVLGGGRTLDQPLSGIRVLRHDSSGAYLEERTSDGSGIVDFGDIASGRTTISFVLKRTQSTQNDPAGQTIYSLVDIPVTSDIKFNVAQNRPSGLTIDLPIAETSAPHFSSLVCLSSVSECQLDLGGANLATRRDTFTSSLSTLTTPFVFYQVQSDGNYSLALSYYDPVSTSSYGPTGCARIVDVPPEVYSPPVTSWSQPVGLPVTVVTQGASTLENSVQLDSQEEEHKNAIMFTRVSGSSQSVGATGSTVMFCKPIEGSKFGLNFLQGPSRLFTAFANTDATSITLPVNDISVSVTYDPQSNPNQVRWSSSGDVSLAAAVFVSVGWPEGGTGSPNFHRFLLFPADSEVVARCANNANLCYGVLPQLPTDLSQLSSPPSTISFSSVQVDVRYFGAGKFEAQGSSSFTPFTPRQVFNRLNTRIGSYSLDVRYDNQSAWSFEVIGQWTSSVRSPV